MIQEGPRLRASHVQATLRALQRRAPEARERVLARLDPATRDGLEGAFRGSFVPARWDADLALAMRAELGGPGTRAVLREMMEANLHGPLLGGLLHSARALFGNSPASLLRWAGRAYSHVSRGCGEITLEESDEESATLCLTGMPAELAIPAYLDAIAGAIEAIFDLCRLKGSVVVIDPEPDGARFRVSWRLPAPRSPRVP